MKETLEQSIAKATQVRAGTVLAAATGTTVTFTSALSTSHYTLSVSCYNTNMENVGYTITNRTRSSFAITPLEDATIEYSAILNQ